MELTTVERVTRPDANSWDVIVVNGAYYERTREPRKIPRAKRVISARNRARNKARKIYFEHDDTLCSTDNEWAIVHGY